MAGLPATIRSDPTVLTTTERAPTLDRSPISTPGPMNTSAQIQASLPILIGAFTRGRVDWWISCEPQLAERLRYRVFERGRAIGHLRRVNVLEHGGRLARQQKIDREEVVNMALLYPDARKAMPECIGPLFDLVILRLAPPQRPGCRSSLVHRPQDRLPVLPCAQNTQD